MPLNVSESGRIGGGKLLLVAAVLVDKRTSAVAARASNISFVLGLGRNATGEIDRSSVKVV